MVRRQSYAWHKKNYYTRTDRERRSAPPYMKKIFFFLQIFNQTHKIDDRQPTHFEIQRFATSITNISKNVQLPLRAAWIVALRADVGVFWNIVAKRCISKMCWLPGRLRVYNTDLLANSLSNIKSLYVFNTFHSKHNIWVKPITLQHRILHLIDTLIICSPYQILFSIFLIFKILTFRIQ